MAQQSTTISLNHLPAALEKAVELAKQNHITDKHLWIGFELREVDVAVANELAAKVAHQIGGAQAQPEVLEVGGAAAHTAKASGGATHAAALPAPSNIKIIGLRFLPKV
jgi:hypothetical protein